jgi:hypothetical protein
MRQRENGKPRIPRLPRLASLRSTDIDQRVDPSSIPVDRVVARPPRASAVVTLLPSLFRLSHGETSGSNRRVADGSIYFMQRAPVRHFSIREIVSSGWLHSSVRIAVMH